ncbi:MAG: TetR family transcriptional regulator C-terminal domain-containing protein, partial [Ruminococcus flavefaciens]|nr:TetR family transcriptional regulator C-terminal domain-containing protein [Ruminococcus flavefaciens]
RSYTEIPYKNMLTDWHETYKKTATGSNPELYGSFFAHLKENGSFYLLLKERGLFHLFQDVYLELFGPKPELDNTWAYISSFISYGMLGWVDEWIKRGMQESADSMAEMLIKTGIK